MKLTDKQELYRIKSSVISSMSRLRLYNSINIELFNDFPTNAPRNIKKIIETGWRGIVSDYQNQMREDAEDNRINSDVFSNYFLNLIGSIYSLNNNEELENATTLNLDMNYFIFSQEIIMVFTYLDAFFSDVLRMLIKIHPEILNRNKKMEWRNILELKNMNSLIQYMENECLLEFGRFSLKKRLEHFEKRLGIKSPLTEKETLDLIELENVRHILVHSNGIIDHEFNLKTGQNSEIGSKYFLSKNLIDKNYNLVKKIVQGIYNECYEKIKK